MFSTVKSVKMPWFSRFFLNLCGVNLKLRNSVPGKDPQRITLWLHADYWACPDGVDVFWAIEDDAKSKFEKRIEMSASDTVESSRFRAITHNNISSVPIMVPGRKHPSTAVRTTDFNNTFLSNFFIVYNAILLENIWSLSAESYAASPTLLNVPAADFITCYNEKQMPDASVWNTCLTGNTLSNILHIAVDFFPKQAVESFLNWVFKWHTIRERVVINQIVRFMLRWTITFLVIALIAAIFGFTGIAAGAAEIAKIIFYIFLVFFVISLITGAFRRTDWRQPEICK